MADATLIEKIEMLAKTAQQNLLTANKIVDDSWANITSALAYKQSKPKEAAESIKQNCENILRILQNTAGTARGSQQETR